MPNRGEASGEIILRSGIGGEVVRELEGPWLDVDLDALRRNAVEFARLVDAPLLPMLKANAYGLGAVPVAKALETVSPWGYGVASIGEAEELRKAGITRPILVTLPFVPSIVRHYLEYGIRPSIGSLAALDVWLSSSDQPFHLVIDTGMGRNGILWHDRAGLTEARRRIERARGYEGVATHFHSADISEARTQAQWNRFERAIAQLGPTPPMIHVGNSGAGQWGNKFAGNLIRPGIFLYGGRAGRLQPEPVVTLTAAVVAVRPASKGDTVSYGATCRLREPAEIVTLAIGYADGVRRSLSGKGLVALNGGVFSIAGRVTMDMTMVTVPPGTVQVGDAATLLGGPIDLDRQAALAGTISFEILTGLGGRVIRRYRGER